MNRPARRTSLLLASCLALPAFAACVIDTDEPPTFDPPSKPSIDRSFAGASPSLRSRAISAAAGHDALLALELAALLPRYPEGGCPAVSSSPEGTVFEGGCDLAGGGRIEGRAVVDLGSDTRPAILRFDRFELETADLALAFDGTVVRTPDSRRFAADLGAVIGGLYAESNLALDCSDGALCEAWSGSTIDVEGLGEIAVSGQWAEGRSPRGYLALTAADDLVISFDGACSTYLIDGASAGKYCLPSPPDVAIRNELSVSSSCLDGRFVVLAHARYDYQRVLFKRLMGVVSGTAGPIELVDDVYPLEPLPSASAGGFSWQADLGACDTVELRGGVVDAEVDGERVARAPIAG